MPSVPTDNHVSPAQLRMDASAGWQSLPAAYAIPQLAPSLKEAQQYCSRLAHSHYEKISDFTCTALQLANFWQDVAVDYGKGRVYLPLEDLAKYGVREDDIAQRRARPAFVEMMKFEVARAREWFRMGLPLAGMVDKHLALDIELFSRGGLEILNAIERQGYDVLQRRPVISKPRKVWLLARAAAGKLL